MPGFQNCHNPTNAIFILNEKIGSIVWSWKNDLIFSIYYCNCKSIQLHVHIHFIYCLSLAFPHIPILPIWRHMCFSQWWHLFLFIFVFSISTLSPSCKKKQWFVKSARQKDGINKDSSMYYSYQSFFIVFFFN